MDGETAVLVARAQAGDRGAFGELYERLAPKLFAYLFHRTRGSAELAEDLTGDVFLKVLERLDRYEDRGLPFATWLCRVAHNHLVDHHRKQPRWATASLEACYDLADPSAERALESGLAREELVWALARLTDEQRRVIVLRYLQDRTLGEAAHALGRTEGAVKQLQYRGLGALRRALGDPSPTASVA